MSERRICLEPVVKQFTTRNMDGQMVQDSKLVACGSDKWSNITKRTDFIPASSGSGTLVARTRTVRTDRPVCAFGHPMGGT